MAFGCLLTLIGYHFGNIDNNSADAQLFVEKVSPPKKAEIVDEIRCRSLVIVGEDDMPRIKLGTDFFDRGQIIIYNEDAARRVYLSVTSDDSGSLDINGKDSGGVAVWLSVDDNGGFMALWNKVLDKPVFQAGITNKGEGHIFTRDKTGYDTWGGGTPGVHTFKEKSRN